MSVNKRKRINLSVSQSLYSDIESIRKRYRFSTGCAMCVTLLRLFVAQVHKAEAEPHRDYESDERFVEEVFDELSHWEPTPTPESVPKRHPRRQVK